jgi:hypothetical protein
LIHDIQPGNDNSLRAENIDLSLLPLPFARDGREMSTPANPVPQSKLESLLGDLIGLIKAKANRKAKGQKKLSNAGYLN